MEKFKFISLSIVTGLAVGFINGFMGAGGGMLVVPILMWLFKFDSKVAHSTAVFVILPICLVSGLTYLIKGVVDYSILWPVLIGTVIGGIIGTFALKKINSNILSLIFFGLMIFAGVWIVVGAV